MKLAQIGTANWKMSKKGNWYISANFYPTVFEKIIKQDFEKKICFMPVNGERHEFMPIICPMPDDYVDEARVAYLASNKSDKTVCR